MEGSLVEGNSVLAPGTVLPPGRLVPSGQLWAGNPARYVRDLSKDEVSHLSPVSLQLKRCRIAHTCKHHASCNSHQKRTDFVVKRHIIMMV